MKTFFDLLDIQHNIDLVISITVLEAQQIEIIINDHCMFDQWTVNGTEWHGTLPLLQPLAIKVNHQSAYVASLLIDGWQARPAWGTELQGCWQFNTDSLPFYQWRHKATGQGWLLIPQV